MLTFDYSEYGCYLNDLSIEELFDIYETTGFIYPEKRKAIEPYYEIIAKNWQKSMDGGLLHVVSYGKTSDPPWASLSTWAHTSHGWQTQHLVGFGGPEAWRGVMLAQQASGIENPTRFGSGQYFYQRKNRFANRSFGSMDESLEPGTFFIEDLPYIALPKPLAIALPKSSSDPITENDIEEFKAFIQRYRSQVYIEAEEIKKGGLELEEIDEKYRSAGLFRYRKIFLHREKNEIVGCVIAFRGPLGLNFSFLENRCELIIKESLPQNSKQEVASSLLREASEYYQDFEPDHIRILTDKSSQDTLLNIGGQLMRTYTQCIWLPPSYQKNYDHVEKIYAQVIKIYAARKKRNKN